MATIFINRIQALVFFDKNISITKRLALLLPYFIVVFSIFLIIASIILIKNFKKEAELHLKTETALLSQALLNSLNSNEIRKLKNPQLALKNALDQILPSDRDFTNTQFVLVENNKIIAAIGDLFSLKINQEFPLEINSHIFVHNDDLKITNLFKKYISYTYLNLKEEPKAIFIAKNAENTTYLGSSTIKHGIVLISGTLFTLYAFAYGFIKLNNETMRLHNKNLAKLKSESGSAIDKNIKEALDVLPSGFCLWGSDDTLILCNSAFAKLHYTKPEDFRIGMPRSETLTRLIGPRQSLMAPLNNEESQTDIQHMSDGRYLQINTHRTKEGGLASVVIDITDLKNHELELTTKRNELLTRVSDLLRMQEGLEIQKAELGKMARNLETERSRAEAANNAKSQFLANMSHDLRTPLNAVIGYAETMKLRALGPLDSTHYEEYPEIIYKSGLQLLSQVDDILDVSRIEKGKMSINKVSTTVDDILEETMPAIFTMAERKAQNLILDIEPDVALHADPRAIRLILQNLLSNAVKFTPNHGEVQLIAKTDGVNIKFIVKDTGEGISPEVLSKLCNPFVQGENAFVRSYQGSGLGLFIAKSLTQLHGGELKISSILNQGSSMIVNIPLIDGSV